MESMSPIPPDPYEALGLSQDCKPTDVKLAYRKLVLKWHPDKVSEDQKEKAQNEFHKVQQAYEILFDEEKRGRYDALIRLAELRRVQFQNRSAGAGLRVDTKNTAGYETRTAVPSSAVPPRGPVRSYTTDDRTRSSYYSDEDVQRSSARRPEYSYVRRGPRDKESDRDRDRARQKDRDSDDRLRRDEERRRAEKLRDTERGYDRSTKSDRFRDEEASRDADRRRKERDAQESRRSSYRDDTDDKQSRAESYIASSRRPAPASRTSSSAQFAYIRPRQPTESMERSPPRERERPLSSRRDPQIVDDRRREPPPLRKNYSEPDPLASMAEKPDAHRSYTTDPDRRRRTSLDDEDRTPSLSRSSTMPTQSSGGSKAHAPSRLREPELASERYSASSGPRIKMYSVDPNLGATLRETVSSTKDSSYRTTIREPTSARSYSGSQKPSLSADTRSGARVAHMMANLASPSARTPISASSSNAYSPYEDRRPAYASTESSRNVRSSRSPEREREPRRSRADERPLYGEIRGTPSGTPSSYMRDPTRGAQSYFPDAASPASASYSRRFADDQVRYSEGRPRASRESSYNDGRPSLSRSSAAVY